jgi:hypothetical protein
MSEVTGINEIELTGEVLLASLNVENETKRIEQAFSEGKTSFQISEIIKPYVRALREADLFKERRREKFEVDLSKTITENDLEKSALMEISMPKINRRRFNRDSSFFSTEGQLFSATIWLKRINFKEERVVVSNTIREITDPFVAKQLSVNALKTIESVYLASKKPPAIPNK